MKRTALQMLVLLAAGAVAAVVSNGVRRSLEWGGSDPILIKHGDVATVSLEDAAAAQADVNTLFLDVRARAEHEASHVLGAVSFPADELEAAYAAVRDFLGPDVKIVLYGDETLPAVRAAEFLAVRGHTARVLDGGWRSWRAKKLPVEGAAATPGGGEQ